MSPSSASAFSADEDFFDFDWTPETANSPEETPVAGGKPKRKSTKGRTLVRWDSDKDQQVLLCVEYWVAKQHIPFDWDAIAKLFGGPTVTGEALKQHLGKLRKGREKDGLPNPPAIGREHRAPGKNSQNNALVAPTKTSSDPFTDYQNSAAKNAEFDLDQQDYHTPYSKHANLVLQKPVKTRATTIKTEGEQTPASKKRKTADDNSTPTKKSRGKKQKPRESSFKTGLETDHLRAQVEMVPNFDPAKGTPATPQPTPTKRQQAKNKKMRGLFSGFGAKKLSAADQQDGYGTPFGNDRNYATAEDVEDGIVDIVTGSATDRAIKSLQSAPPPVDDTVAGGAHGQQVAAIQTIPTNNFLPLTEDPGGPSTIIGSGFYPVIANGGSAQNYDITRPMSPAAFTIDQDYYPMGEIDPKLQAQAAELNPIFHAITDNDVFGNGYSAPGANVGTLNAFPTFEQHVGATDWEPLRLTEEPVAKFESELPPADMSIDELIDSGFADVGYYNKVKSETGYGHGHWMNKNY